MNESRDIMHARHMPEWLCLDDVRDCMGNLNLEGFELDCKGECKF